MSAAPDPCPDSISAGPDQQTLKVAVADPSRLSRKGEGENSPVSPEPFDHSNPLPQTICASAVTKSEILLPPLHALPVNHLGETGQCCLNFEGHVQSGWSRWSVVCESDRVEGRLDTGL
ncbi:hypothetical protein Bbelb_130620 [Branchiostoma belcheri]|nr:hypothetical protein Bbelb_130620 [Branchiostoma belcheri]